MLYHNFKLQTAATSTGILHHRDLHRDLHLHRTRQ
jgi:hypothetical protein